MAALDLQEQEQLDAFKAWWDDNRNFVILSVVLLLGGIGGVQAWRSYHSTQSVKASQLFADVRGQVASADPKRINDAAQAVIDKFGSSAYAPRAALLAARIDVRNKDDAQAKVRLQWVQDNAKEDGLKDLARLQLASLLLDEKKYDDALKLVESVPRLNESSKDCLFSKIIGDAAYRFHFCTRPSAFGAMYADLKGDVLVAQGKTEEARAAYQMAYNKMDDKSPYRNLLQMKLDSVGGAK